MTEEVYEDDFEDYAEDFEEEEESKVKEDQVIKIKVALEEENAAAITRSKNRSPQSEPSGPKIRQSPVPIGSAPNNTSVKPTSRRNFDEKEESDFKSSPSRGIIVKKKEKTSAQNDRVSDILKLVQFEEQSHDLLDIAPLSDYDIYLRKILSNKLIKAASTQTKEDDRSIETQTEKISKTNRSCQWPDDLGVTNYNKAEDKFKEVDYDRLHNFLYSSSQVISVSRYLY